MGAFFQKVWEGAASSRAGGTGNLEEWRGPRGWLGTGMKYVKVSFWCVMERGFWLMAADDMSGHLRSAAHHTDGIKSRCRSKTDARGTPPKKKLRQEPRTRSPERVTPTRNEP